MKTKPKVKKYKKGGYDLVSYSSPHLRFVMYFDGRGFTEILGRGQIIFCKEDAKHKDRLKQVLEIAKENERQANILRRAAKEMSKYTNTFKK